MSQRALAKYMLDDKKINISQRALAKYMLDDKTNKNFAAGPSEIIPVIIYPPFFSLGFRREYIRLNPYVTPPLFPSSPFDEKTFSIVPKKKNRTCLPQFSGSDHRRPAATTVDLQQPPVSSRSNHRCCTSFLRLFVVVKLWSIRTHLFTKNMACNPNIGIVVMYQGSVVGGIWVDRMIEFDELLSVLADTVGCSRGQYRLTVSSVVYSGGVETAFPVRGTRDLRFLTCPEAGFSTVKLSVEVAELIQPPTNYNECATVYTQRAGHCHAGGSTSEIPQYGAESNTGQSIPVYPHMRNVTDWFTVSIFSTCIGAYPSGWGEPSGHATQVPPDYPVPLSAPVSMFTQTSQGYFGGSSSGFGLPGSYAQGVSQGLPFTQTSQGYFGGSSSGFGVPGSYAQGVSQGLPFTQQAPAGMFTSTHQGQYGYTGSPYIPEPIDPSFITPHPQTNWSAPPDSEFMSMMIPSYQQNVRPSRQFSPTYSYTYSDQAGQGSGQNQEQQGPDIAHQGDQAEHRNAPRRGGRERRPTRCHLGSRLG